MIYLLLLCVIFTTPAWALDIPTGVWTAKPWTGTTATAPTNKGKHTRFGYHSPSGWWYALGGDHGGSGSAGGPTTQNGRQEMYRYHVETNTWDLVQSQCRLDNGPMPMGPDEVGFTWDSTRQVFWHVPGFNHNHGTDACGANNLHRHKMMRFSVSSDQWVDETNFPNFSRSLVASITGNYRYFVYDSITDTIVGVQANAWWMYHIDTDTWERVGGFTSLDAGGDEYLARDPLTGFIYLVENRNQGELWRFDPSTKQAVELGPLPASVPYREKEAQAHWDPGNGVLLWPVWRQLESPGNDNEIDAFYAYHPGSDTWEVLSRQVQGVCPENDCTLRGRHSLFDPVSNALVVFRPKGGGVLPGNAPVFLYRYGESVPDVEAPLVPQNLHTE